MADSKDQDRREVGCSVYVQESKTGKMSRTFCEEDN